MSLMSFSAALRSRRLQGLILATVLGGSASAIMAQTKLGEHNSEAPVNYAADRIEVQDKANRVLLSGHVDVTQDGLRMQAAQTVVAYINDGGVKIQRIDATGGVTITRSDEQATGEVANYDFNRRIITLVGHVTLRNDRGNSQGERLVIDLDRHLSSFVGGAVSGEGASSGRVVGSFNVAKRSDASK
ncbi:OstA family protein [Novosphingobium umbonatum]|uniref:OstA family protein n=1 Tax=Novosphingobium umbonatum TaxID=1908524 RepID=A0A437N2U8_9SPHN|nr:LptA/OstA family protein [Novosphingobium umbonatum]RVU04251.1 OstA family protein [Novosphingobium umbonatum]